MATLLLKTLAKETHKRPLFNKLSTPWDLKAFSFQTKKNCFVCSHFTHFCTLCLSSYTVYNAPNQNKKVRFHAPKNPENSLNERGSQSSAAASVLSTTFRPHPLLGHHLTPDPPVIIPCSDNDNDNYNSNDDGNHNNDIPAPPFVGTPPHSRSSLVNP